MNKRMISFILGTLLILEAVILLLPALVALIYAERAGWYYLFTALGAALAGLALPSEVTRQKPRPLPEPTERHHTEAAVPVALCL